jgi:hypothetical protein
MWSGRCYLKTNNCESGNYRSPAACDAGLMVRSGECTKKHDQIGFIIIIINNPFIEILGGMPKDNERISRLDPMLVPLRNWVQTNYWNYAISTKPIVVEDDPEGPDWKVGKHDGQKFTKDIWINSIDSGTLEHRRFLNVATNDFGLGPNEKPINNTERDGKCSDRNQLIRESGGCPVLPPRPLTEGTTTPDPTATTRKIRGNKNIIIFFPSIDLLF